MHPHKWLMLNHFRLVWGAVSERNCTSFHLQSPAWRDPAAPDWRLGCVSSAQVCVLTERRRSVPRCSRTGPGPDQEPDQKSKIQTDSIIGIINIQHILKTSVSQNDLVCLTCKDVHWPDSSSNFGLFGTEGGSFRPESKRTCAHVILYMN